MGSLPETQIDPIVYPFGPPSARVLWKRSGFRYVWADETEVFEYDDAMHHVLLELRMLCEDSYRISIVLAFRVDGRKRFQYSASGRALFRK